MNDKPNVLFIMTDQQRKDTLSCYGNRAIRTPCLDSLAEEGAMFEHFFVNNPVCVPSRCSFLTGRYPGSHRSRDLETGLDPGETHLFRIMKEAGYRLGLIGKNHALSQGGLAMFDELDLMRHKKTPLPETGKRYGSGVDPVDPRKYTTHRMGESATAFIRQSVERNRPFCLWFSIPDPHPPYQVPEPYASMASRERISLPAEPLLDSSKPDIQKALRLAQGMDGATEEDMIRLRMIYYGMVAFIDEVVGSLLALLKQLNIDENTIVVFTSDHGEYLGDHGLVRKNWSFYDCLMNVPFLIRWKGTIEPRTVSGTLAESVDMLPTICDLLGLDIPEYVQGKSLSPVLCATTKAHKDKVFAEAGNPGQSRIQTMHEWETNPDRKSLWNISAVQGVMLRTLNWKLCQYVNGEGELYHLADDPAETLNLYGEERVSERQAQLMTQLAVTMMECQDPRRSSGDPMGGGRG